MKVWCEHCGTYHESEPIVGTYNDVEVCPCVVCGKLVRGAVIQDDPKCFHCGNAGKMPYIM
jgi:hypothetical protein